jgi:hypothetical protein
MHKVVRTGDQLSDFPEEHVGIEIDADPKPLLAQLAVCAPSAPAL